MLKGFSVVGEGLKDMQCMGAAESDSIDTVYAESTANVSSKLCGTYTRAVGTDALLKVQGHVQGHSSSHTILRTLSVCCLAHCGNG